MAQVAKSWLDGARREIAEGGEGPIPVVLADPAQVPRGTALILHGRNGAPDQVQISMIAEAYLARGWRVAVPELPHSIALPASGPPERLTMAGHRAAAGQVRDWALARWQGAVLAVAGQSLGAFAAAHLGAGAHHVLAVSPVISGRTLLAARVAMGPPAVEALEREVPDLRAGMEAEDAAPALASLGPPLAVIAGALDGIVPLAHARAYFDAAPNSRFFAAIPGQHHCPEGPDYATMLTAALVAVEA
jgi:fermentation-respiration switch protein FrsA (DUF1100 family)